MAGRAHAAADKQARRDAIVAAARRLFAQGDGGLPSAVAIAQAAGLAKGTLYLYFTTKEAIFAAVLLDGWTAALGEVEAAFADPAHGSAPTDGSFLAGYAARMERDPELLRLDALGAAVIERNLDPVAYRAFKDALEERLAATGAAMDRALAQPDGRGVQLLKRAYALTRGLWLSWEGPGFGRELAEALGEYWRGANADRAA